MDDDPPKPGVLLRSRGPRWELRRVDKVPFVIGRDPACDLVLDSPVMANRHAVIVRDGWDFAIEKLPDATALSIGGGDGHGRKLTAGMVIETAGFAIDVVGVWPFEDLTRPLAFECRGLVCSGRVDISATVRTPELERAIDAAAVACLPGELGFGSDGITAELGDPVGTLLGVRAFVETLAGLPLQVTLRSLAIGCAAIELLEEAGEPARAAWQWLWTHSALEHITTTTHVRGIATSPTAFDRLRAEHETRDPRPGPGLLLWLAGFGNVLLWVDRDILVGRDPSCDLVIRDVHIARRQAQLVRAADRWRCRLLSFSGRARVNGHRLAYAKLAAGDVIQLGPHVQITVLEVY